MDDREIGAAINAEIKKYFHGAVMLTDEACELMGKAARELLAPKVATRESLREFMRGKMWSIDDVLDAISHFAPPRQRMMIEGMSRQEIEAEMYLRMEEKRKRMEGVIYVQECARVAHRLATTPASEVDADADAGAKAAFQRYQDAKPNGWLRERWHELNEDGKNCWRAVAAMEKGNG